MKHPITLIFGPTASGKTSYALKLAQGKQDILSADARQIYQDMSIVTGRDLPVNATASSRTYGKNTVPVWELPTGTTLFGHDIVPPNQEFSIAHWYRYVQPILEEHLRNEQPLIVVGGSWPYLSVLFDPPPSLFVPPNPAIREQTRTWPLHRLQTELERIHRVTWDRLNQADRHNPRRLIRALEVAQADTSLVPHPLVNPADIQLVVPEITLAALESKIATRVTERWQHGALKETQLLMQRYPDWNTPAFSSTGYAFLRQHLVGELTAEQAQQLWIRQERQYAKRQFTWLRALPHKYPDLWARRETF